MLSLLVISMPAVSALSISSYTLKGSYGSQDVVKDNDYFFVSASIDGNITDSTRIRISYNSQDYVFDNCTTTGISSVCYYNSTIKSFVPGLIDYSIKLYDSSFAVVDTKQGTIRADSSDPAISSVITSRPDGLLINYSVTDKLCDSCANCSGVKKVELKQNFSLKKAYVIDSTSCSYNGSAIEPYSSLNVSDGQAELCLEAYDLAGRMSNRDCRIVNVDSTKPVIEENSFELVDELGNKISYKVNGSISFSVRINITEANLSNATAVFPMISNSSIAGSCERESYNSYLCEWSGLSMSQLTSFYMLINATDSTGNSEWKNLSYSLASDNVAPEVIGISVNGNSAISSNTTSGSAYYFKQGLNHVSVSFSEAGSGFARRNAYIFVQGQSIKAESCIRQSASEWVCSWNLSIGMSHLSKGYITITGDSSDDSGNRIVSDKSYLFVVDAKEPEVISYSELVECPYNGQMQEYTIIVADDSPVRAVFDVSAFAEDSSVNSTCIYENKSYSCTASVSNFYSVGGKFRLNITISDAAGNINYYSHDTEVCVQSQAKPNFFSVSASPMQKIDKRVLSFMSVPVYAAISLNPKAGAYPIEKSISCQGISDAHFIGEDKSTSFLLAFSYPKGSVNSSNSSGQLSCEISLIVRQGYNIYSEPETEKFTIPISFYGAPLNSLSEEMQDKIDSLEDEISSMKDDIESYEQWYKYFEMWCNIAKMLGTINSILKQLYQSLYFIECTLEHNPPTAAKAIADWFGICKSQEGFHAFIERFIWASGLPRPDTIIGSISKYACLILNSCAICDSQTYISMLTGLGAGAVSSDGYYDTEDNVIYSTKELKDIGSYIESEDIGKLKELQTPGAFTSQQKSSSKSKDSEGWLVDPFKSIHYANACLCLTAIIYNMKKERQITCIKKKCYEEHAKVGLPLTNCDLAYKERYCLYVDSAAYVKYGFDPSQIVKNFFNAIISSLLSIALQFAWLALCYDLTTTGTAECMAPGVCADKRSPWCAIIGSSNTLLEIIGAIKNIKNLMNRKSELTGTDYCD